MKLTAEKRMKDYCGDYPIRIAVQKDGIGINLMSGIWELETAKEFYAQLGEIIRDIEFSIEFDKALKSGDEAVIADSIGYPYRGGGDLHNATISRERDGEGVQSVSERGAI